MKKLKRFIFISVTILIFLNYFLYATMEEEFKFKLDYVKQLIDGQISITDEPSTTSIYSKIEDTKIENKPGIENLDGSFPGKHWFVTDIDSKSEQYREVIMYVEGEYLGLTSEGTNKVRYKFSQEIENHCCNAYIEIQGFYKIPKHGYGQGTADVEYRYEFTQGSINDSNFETSLGSEFDLCFFVRVIFGFCSDSDQLEKSLLAKFVDYIDFYTSNDTKIYPIAEGFKGFREGLIGSNFPIVETGNNDRYPAVTFGNGNFFIVYVYEYSSTDWDIKGKLVSPDGTVVDSVSIDTSGAKSTAPSVAYDSDHQKYLIVWEHVMSGTGSDIYGKILNSDLSTYVETFTISNETKDELHPNVEYVDLGDFLVVWSRTVGYYTEGNIMARGVRYSGTLRSIKQITDTTKPNIFPKVAYNWNDRCLVVWQYPWSMSGSDVDSWDWDIHAQITQFDGTPVGNRITIAGSLNPDTQSYIAYSQTSNRFLVVWEEGKSSTDHDIIGDIIDISGDSINTIVNNFVIYDSVYRDYGPRIAWNSQDDEWMVVWWHSFGGSDTDWDIYGNIVKPNGDVGSKETFSGADLAQQRPSISFGNGTYLCTWQDNRSGSNWDIYGQRYGEPPTITVISPNGEEVWWKGEVHNITWDPGVGTGSDVKIDLYKGGTDPSNFWTTIEPTTPNNGSLSWDIGIETPGTDYKVKITSLSNSSYYDFSDNYFTIKVPAQLTVTRPPDGGCTWYAGTTEEITWTSTGDVGSEVRITLWKGDSYYSVLKNPTPNDGSDSCRIPSWIPTGSDYRIKITSNSTGIYDFSDYFNIESTISYPNGGENWYAGATETINWRSSSLVGSNVRITLWKGNSYYSVLKNPTPNDGSDSCRIPSWIPTGSDYRIKITSNSGWDYDFSDNYFTIESTITRPNSGETFYRDTTEQITWRASGLVGSEVRITLWKGNSYYTTIVNPISNSGSYTWYIPTSLPTGSDFRIKITSNSDGSSYDFSDGYFSIY